jgi:hypothetical protein
VVQDTITGQFAASDSPSFVADRFGVANAAILISGTGTWTLPQGSYYQGDTTVTMWVNKLTCTLVYGVYGKSK